MTAFDIEQALVEWLPGKLGVPCLAEVPSGRDGPGGRPEAFVSVERTGGESSLGVDRPLLAVQAWGRSAAEASELALRVRDALVLDSWEMPEVCRCSVTGIYRFPDPDSRQSRYQLDVEAVTRP